MDGDADHEDSGDSEPSLAAPANVTGSQVGYMRGSDRDGETDAPEILLSKGRIKGASDPFILPWKDHSNIVAACGAALLNLASGRKLLGSR